MKYWIIALLLLGTAHAQPHVVAAQAKSDAAREAYRQGRFADAARDYLMAWQLARVEIALKNAIKIYAQHLGDCPSTLRWAKVYQDTKPETGRAQEVAGYQARCLVERAKQQHARGATTGAERTLAEAAALPLSLPARLEVERAQAALKKPAAPVVVKAPAGPVAVTIQVVGPDKAPVPNTRVQIDGRPVVPSANGVVQVQPGQRALLASAPGHLDAARQFTATEGATVALTLAPRTAPPSNRYKLRVAGFSALGVAVLAGGGALAWDLHGQDKVDELDRVAEAGTDRATYDALREDVDNARTGTIALYSIAGAAAVASAILLGIGYSDPGVTVTPAPGGAAMGWTW